MESDFEVDAIDLQLLDLLQTDASLTNKALAERVHVSPPTCLRRVRRLQAAGLPVFQTGDRGCGDAGLAIGQAWVAARQLQTPRQEPHVEETVPCA